ncbi:MAG: demethoxyubiquinone hydroxylase family protein [Proteobacteria bacterium]|nr:demethoxyubiquinone hydroxylase family protein [Pseudomonadota bacterium]
MNKKSLGSLTQQQELEQAIRVDHAGEYGAQRIYSGQIAVFKSRKLLPSFLQNLLNESPEDNQKTIELLEHMKEQEDVHFDYFNKKIVDEKVRPTAMQPIWNVAGFALGAVTALMGKKAAMTCTVAVEEVIDEHYQEQLSKLEDKELKENIEKFRQEELEHRDIGLENDAEESKIFHPLSFIIKKASKAAIFISSKI